MSADSTAAPLPPQPLDAWFLDLLACPGCTERLPLHPSADNTSLLCQCGRYAFPIREDGMPIMIMEDATLLDENAHPENSVK